MRASPKDKAVRAHPLGDLHLVQIGLNGDRQAIETIAQRMRIVPRLLRTINRRRGHPLSDHELEDLAQDVVIQILERLDRFKGLGTLDGYSYRFCVYEFMNRVRRETRRRERASTSEGEELQEEVHDTNIDAEAVEVALQGLGPDEEEAVRLKHSDDLSFTELGERLGISPNTVKARYYRGLESLRERLAAHGEYFR